MIHTEGPPLEMRDPRVDLADEERVAEKRVAEKRVAEKIVNYIFSNYNI